MTRGKALVLGSALLGSLALASVAGSSPASAQGYYCPPGYYYAQGYGCYPYQQAYYPPAPVYYPPSYYAAPAYVGPAIGFDFRFGGGHGWHGHR
jgi:hypothetical protein